MAVEGKFGKVRSKPSRAQEQPRQLTGSFPPVILARYGLDGRKDAQVVHSNALAGDTQDDGLGDPRLEKLWHKVPGFPTSGNLS